MTRNLLTALGVIVLLCTPAAADPDDETSSCGEALKKGEFKVALRYRMETVEDDDPVFAGRDAYASTLRTSVSYASARYHGFGIFAEFEDVSDLGRGDDHNNLGSGDLANGVSNRPAIGDPEITELQQFALRYRGWEGIDLKAGRQEVNFGEQRFLGAVGWRQHHQTFDALRVDTDAIPRTTLSYAFLDRANRIFGDSKPMDTNAVLAKVDTCDCGDLYLYGYLLDYADPGDAGLSTTTIGARWKGSFEPGKYKVPYLVEYATQSDASGNPSEIDAAYVRAEATVKRRDRWLRVGYELLEGDTANGAFQTPLATLHKWNGRADKFLVTPPNGLRDLYAGIGRVRGDWIASIVYHDFESDSAGIDYGSEWDAQVTWTSGWDQTFALTFADYDADAFSFDTQKLWLWTSYTF